MRVDQEWLQDIFEAIEKVEKYAARGREAFEQEELVQVWVIHHLQIIGEAAGRISDEIQERYQEFP